PVFLKGEPVSGRIADNLFWFGRYSKRCENNVRLLRKIFAHIVSPEEADSLNEKTMLEILRIQTGALPENFIIENIRHAESINILVTYLFRDSLRPGSFIFNLKSMIYSARNIRNLLSDDIWHVINSFDLEVSWIGENPAMIIERLGRLMIGFSALRGLCQENLNKGIGWRFWDIGVSIEKATNTLTLLEHTLNSNENQRYLWQLLLDIEESFITPGLNYHMDWTSISLLGLFLQDETNPRSVISQLLNIQNHLAHLPSENEMYNETRKITLDCLSRSRIFEAMSDKVLNEIDSAGFARIPSEILALIRTLSENMGRTYFDFEDRTRQLI
ncbi:MAG: alpha-E domain-containing protein, partial [Leptospira sp.]|nr:alpha-E domain-containing protein [Leptospira sp.]